MSGSGGGGGGGGAGGGGGGFGSPSEPACDKLIFKTSLNSPVPAVVKKLKVGDTLQVSAESEHGPAVAVTSDGKVAGSITSAQLLRLLSCIAEGFAFVAIVISVSGGNVQVEIRPEASP